MNKTMEKISEIIGNRRLTDSPAFKAGAESMRKGEYKVPTKNYYWVSKLITMKEWESWYSKHISYTYLGEDFLGKTKLIKIGFLTCNLSDKVEEITDPDELRKIDLHNRACNISPTPFEALEDK
jgi:hypothetical protein